MVHKLIIIGSGPAGLTAAIYAARANLRPILFEGQNPGGPLTTAWMVENYPGFPEGIDGAELISAMRKQAEKFGTEFVSEDAAEVDFSKKPLRIKAGGKNYQAESVIAATGTTALTLGLESEKRLAGRGVSYCATCDGPLFKNKKVAVVGGGNSALQEALYLSNLAKEIVIVQNLADFTATPILRERVKETKNISAVFNTEIKDFIGDKKLEKIILRNNQTGKESELEIDGVFMAIGRKPNTKIFEGKLKMDKGFIVTEPDGTKTNIAGVFAAGDAVDKKFRQGIVAAGRGAMAAMEAERYLANNQ